jgi:hypothetical protein
MSDGDRLCIEVLLYLDIGVVTGLSYVVQLLSIVHQLLGLGTELADGDFLFLEQGLFLIQPHPPCYRLLLLRGSPFLEQGAPLSAHIGTHPSLSTEQRGPSPL